MTESIDRTTSLAQPRLDRFETRTEWPLAAVAIIFLAAYSYRVLAQPQGLAERTMDVVIWTTWAVFLVDYVVRLYLATDRAHWFFRHLLDLAIVALPLLRPLRLLRLVVLVSILEKAIGGAIRGRVVIYTAASVVLLVYVASLAILETERYVPHAYITTFGNAVWWSITTITTVGYGDLTPVTTTGRMIAVTLMVGGISLVGVVTATLASWIIEQVSEEDSAKQAATARQIDGLRAEMKSQNEALCEEIRQLSGLVRSVEPGRLDKQ
jgi:voltage-gated potassium channel